MRKYTDEQLRAMGLHVALPKHVAMIMDGNGRWAKKRGLPRPLGHRAGMERLRGLIRLTSDLGIQALSLYAFSTENWKRPQEEISALCELLVEYFKKEIHDLHAQQVCVRALGSDDPFPAAVRGAVREAAEKTANNTGLKLNIALNYGAQDEMLRAVQAIAYDVEQGSLKPDEISMELLESRLDTSGLPMVDFLIRTGGEERLSNFLLFQSAYAELLFVDDYWPDFSDERYIQSLRIYQKRDRRYGGL